MGIFDNNFMTNQKTDRPLTDSEKLDCERFARLFREREESQGALGYAIGLSQDMISKISRGKRAITIDCAIALSNHWGVAVHEISPEIQLKINSAYNSPAGGNIGDIITGLQKLNISEVMAIMDELQLVIKRKIQDIKVNDEGSQNN